MRRLFDPENVFFSTLSLMVDVVGLSLFWLFLSLPIITAGPAAAALYRSVVAMRQGDGRTFTHFLRSFRDNWKQGILVTVPCEVAAWLLYQGWRGLFLGQAASVFQGVYCAVLVLPLGLMCWIFPLMGRFTFKTGQLFRTALQLTVVHLPTTILAVAVTAVGVVLSLKQVLMFAVLPMLVAVVKSLLFERVFRKYLPTEET